MTPVTQKAKGIRKLEEFDFYAKTHFGQVVDVPVVAVASVLNGGITKLFKALDDWTVKRNIKLFFRPCPLTPKHGFVDSRICSTREEIEALWAETMAVEPMGEILVMPLIAADLSAVATSTSISIGNGNDGATVGKDTTTYTLTTPDVSAMMRADIAVPLEDEVYAEALYVGKNAAYKASRAKAMYLGENHSAVVQLRGGPRVANASAKSIIPTTFKVVEVIYAGGDLLAWERKMAEYKDSVGALVHHPGGSPLSHYAVHAVLNNVAITFEAEAPKLGSMLESNKDEALPEYDVRKIRLGIVKALAAAPNAIGTENRGGEALIMAATGVHSALSLRTGDSAEYLGGAMATLMLLSSAACCGELRHRETLRSKLNLSGDRDVVYQGVFAQYIDSRKILRESLASFASHQWAAGFGGRAWAFAAAQTIDLEVALLRLVKGGSDIARCIKLAHRLLNAVHNNGKLLNKFAPQGVFDIAANGSRRFALHGAFFWHEAIRSTTAVDTLVAEAIQLASLKDIKSTVFAAWDSERGAFFRKGEVIADPKTVVVARVAVVNGVSIVKIQHGLERPEPKPVSFKKRRGRKPTTLQNVLGDGPQTEVPHTTLYTPDPVLLEAVRALPLNSRSLAWSGAMYAKATNVEVIGTYIRATFGDVVVGLAGNLILHVKKEGGTL